MILMRRPKGRRPIERTRHSRRIILKLILQKWDGEAWTGFLCLRIETVVGTCECDNEPSGSIKCGEFVE